jgi:hypothetical protein
MAWALMNSLASVADFAEPPATGRAEVRPLGWSWSLGALALAGLWMLARPFTGVRHDGILYLGQIYLQSAPDIYQNDMFFAFGSQDQFSMFSRLGAWLVSHLGLVPAQLALLATCHGLLLLSAASLIRPLKSVPLRVAALANLAVMPHFYGGMGVFSFAETFVTARTLAEPLALAGLALLLGGRAWLAFAALLAAAAVHPLMALPALVLALLWLAWDRSPRWLWLGPLVVLAIGWAAVAGIRPFDALLKIYDAQWLAIVEASNPFVFPHMWSLENWLNTGFVTLTLLIAGRCMPPPLARMATLMAGVSVMLLLISAWGTGTLNNLLVTQLQLWRALWLAHLLALLLLPAIVVVAWRRGPAWQPVAVSMAALAIATLGFWPGAWVFAVWLALVAGLAIRASSVHSRASLRAVQVTSWVALLSLSAAMLARNLSDLADKGVPLNASVVLWALATTPLISLALVFAALKGLPRLRQARMAGAAATLLILFVGVSEWDRRTEQQRVFEATPPHPHPFTLSTRPDSQVYWRESLLTTWAMIRRPSFFADQQGSGVLFNRANAMEFERRRRLLSPLSFQREICMMLAGLDRNEAWGEECRPEPELIRELCRATDGPDYLVFPFAMSQGVVSQWSFQPRAGKATTYFLHDCASFR